MAFTAAELTELRLFAGYPALGVGGLPGTVEAIALEAALAAASPEVETRVRLIVLPRLRAAEEVLTSAMATLDTKKAAVWERNPNAFAEAEAWLGLLRRGLVDLFGLPLGPFGYSAGPPLPAIFVV